MKCLTFDRIFLLNFNFFDNFFSNKSHFEPINRNNSVSILNDAYAVDLKSKLTDKLMSK